GTWPAKEPLTTSTVRFAGTGATGACPRSSSVSTAPAATTRTAARARSSRRFLARRFASATSGSSETGRHGTRAVIKPLSLAPGLTSNEVRRSSAAPHQPIRRSAMSDDRSQLGFLVAALGAAVLAVSVFLPWYGVSITASGAATAQQQLTTVAQQY